MAREAKYRQVESFIKDGIRDGSLKVGSRIMTEEQLCEHFGYSRMTINKALNSLAAEGYIKRVPGKGSFVAGGNKELLREERLRAIEGLLVQAADEARAANVTVQELHDMLALIAESDDR